MQNCVTVIEEEVFFKNTNKEHFVNIYRVGSDDCKYYYGCGLFNYADCVSASG